MKSAISSDEMLLDTSLLASIARATARRWAARGILAAIILTIIGLLTIPQKFASTSSLALDEGGGGTSSLAALTGAKPSNREIGILKSRRLASIVCAQAKIKKTFSLTTDEDAIVLLQKGLTVEESPIDGLLDVTVTLSGPPHYGPGASERRKLISAKAAEAANDYVAAFQKYYADNDTDKGSVLLRTADVETRHARSDYDHSVQNLTGFLDSLKGIDPRAVPTSSGTAGSAPTTPASSQLTALYDDLEHVESAEEYNQAGLQTVQQLTSNQVANVPNLPTEDPLLTAARDRVTSDKANLASLSVTYGPDHPSIIMARNQLRGDQAVLAAQIQGVKRNLSSQHINSLAQLNSLAAQKALLKQQIAAATSHLTTGREIGSVLARLESEVDIRLDVLKTTMTEAAKVRMENASAASRTSVVDTAIPQRKGTPGAAIILAGALAIVLLGYIYLVLKAYLYATSATPVVPVAASSNGTMHAPVSTLKPRDDAEERLK